MYTAAHIANFMLDRAEEGGRALSPMKLLKLVYIAQGWNLAIFGKPLFDEPIFAWDHGPVIRSLYDEFKHYGANAIESPATDLDLDSGEFKVPKIPKEDEETSLILNKVWDIYSRFTAAALRNKTHEENTPWSTVYEKGVRNIVIPDNLIKDHFTMKIGQYLENAS